MGVCAAVLLEGWGWGAFEVAEVGEGFVGGAAAVGCWGWLVVLGEIDGWQCLDYLGLSSTNL